LLSSDFTSNSIKPYIISLTKAATAIMVCSKCQKLTKGTTLATPEVKKKSEMYYGSPASSSKGADKKSVTLANAGVTKVGPPASHLFYSSPF